MSPGLPTPGPARMFTLPRRVAVERNVGAQLHEFRKHVVPECAMFLVGPTVGFSITDVNL